jgi:rhamnulose-1-phosphate aldolase
MTALSTGESWFVAAMVKATGDMWSKGWDERNGGNISLRLADREVEPYLPFWQRGTAWPLGETMAELAGQYFLVTGSGKYFRNIQLDPETNLGVIRISSDGRTAEQMWGYRGGGVPTSELPAHLKSHRARQRQNAGRSRVVMHCHATNLIALSYVLELDAANVTRALWEGSTECLVVFPEGVGILDWMVPGTDSIGDATAELFASHPLVLWPYHGVFAVGDDLDESFGLIDTAEKSAEILVKVISMGGARQTMTTQNLVDLAKRFAVEPFAAAISLDGWCLSKTTEALASAQDLLHVRQSMFGR